MTESMDSSFVELYSGLYKEHNLGSLETHLLSEIHLSILNNGCISKAQLIDIAEWKSKRARKWIRSNSDDDVREISRIAMDAPHRLSHRFLQLLNGVGEPMASAILTVWRPEEFTVVDVRLRTALMKMGVERAKYHDESERFSYPKYCKMMRELADECDCSLRNLDRALWKWDEAKPKFVDQANGSKS